LQPLGSQDANVLTVWDAKPETAGRPINWVELKTTAEIHTHNDRFKFDRKLMRYWIQSFLLGVPKIIVGFRTQGGILSGVEEFSTLSMPQDVQRRKTAKWDGNVCIKFASLFLDCMTTPRLHTAL
jgi:RAT1-interacting protein